MNKKKLLKLWSVHTSQCIKLRPLKYCDVLWHKLRLLICEIFTLISCYIKQLNPAAKWSALGVLINLFPKHLTVCLSHFPQAPQTRDSRSEWDLKIAAQVFVIFLVSVCCRLLGLQQFCYKSVTSGVKLEFFHRGGFFSFRVALNILHECTEKKSDFTW